jgi:phosphoglycerate dehydrogenase-like enzyme
VIVLLESIHPDAVALLEGRGEVRLTSDPLVVDADVPRRGVEAILTRGRGRITAAMLDEFPDLVVVGRCGAGVDNIDVEAAAGRGIAVVNAPGATTAAVAEHAVLLMLGIARRISVLDAAVKAGRWSVREGYEGIELRGKRLGVVGLGSIGRRVAELGRAFEMDVVYWSRSSRADGLVLVDVDELLATSDVVQLCIALSVDTRHLLDAPRLARMSPSAIVVNTSRGAIVDHGALIAAISAGRLAGYAADVWEPEPPPADEVAALGDRLLITPHVAAITDVTYREICVRTVDCALAVLERGEEVVRRDRI